MLQKQPIHILAISGSLKAASTNTLILQELALLKAPAISYSIFEGLEEIPAFNPDKEEGNAAVKYFKQQLQAADGVVISTPEYAFGMPGVLKNALDWTVSSGELNDKPVIAISASPLATGGNKAMASLLPTLSALGTKMDERSHLCIPTILKKLNAHKRISDSQTLLDLKTLFDHLIHKIQSAAIL